MRFLGKAMTGVLLSGAVFGLAACGSSSSSSSSSGEQQLRRQQQRREHRRHLLEPSASGSLHAHNRSRWSTASSSPCPRPAARPARSKSTTSRLTTRPRSAGKWDANQTAANARKVGDRYEGRLLHRRVQLRRQRGLDPDPQRGGRPAGQPGEHVRRTDHERPGKCARRAAEVLPDGQAHVPAARPARHDPVRRRPDHDEEGRLHESRGRQRQGGLRRRARRPAQLQKAKYGLK